MRTNISFDRILISRHTKESRAVSAFEGPETSYSRTLPDGTTYTVSSQTVSTLETTVITTTEVTSYLDEDDNSGNSGDTSGAALGDIAVCKPEPEPEYIH